MKKSKGDEIRSMNDKKLAQYINQIEKDAFNCGKGGGKMTFGKKNIDFWTGYLGSPEGEDY